MDRLTEIRQRYEQLPPWEDDSEDIRYLLSEVDRLNTVRAEYASNSAEITINGRQYVPKDTIAAMTARAEAAEARADAAVEDWKAYEENGQCDVCKYGEGGGCVYPEGNRCRFEWRGQQAGEGDSNATNG